jgi:hypothetical protein
VAFQARGGAANFMEEPADRFDPDPHRLNNSTLVYPKERLAQAIQQFTGSDIFIQIRRKPAWK